MLLQCSNDELSRSYSCWFETEDSRGIRQSRDRDMQITASRDSLEPRQLPVSRTIHVHHWILRLTTLKSFQVQT